MYAQTNAPFPNRIQIVLDPYVGPFVQDGPLGSFDPRRDLEVWIDGVLTPVQTFAFDANNNRYLLYMATEINLQGVIQVVHHMPSPPFQYTQNPALFDLTPGQSPGIDGGGS
jgi:hypothetical protein